MGRKTILYFLGCAIFMTFLQKVCFSQQLKSQWTDAKHFCLSNTKGLEKIWGEAESIPAVYFEEVLPAFFQRKVSFQNFQLNKSKLKWIFTGEQGGITVSIGSDSVELSQRYYDSYGFNGMLNNAFVAKRFPQKEFASTKIHLNNISIRSVTVEVNHLLGLKLFFNDSLIIEQLTQVDLSKHQLQAEGMNIDACGKLELPAPDEVTLNVWFDKKHQEILGFGGITSPVAYNMLGEKGKAKWWNLLREYNLLIQREYPIGRKLKEDFSNWDNLAEATPHYYGDNFPNGEVSDFSYNKKIQDIGGMVVFEFWELPDWVINKAVIKNDKPGLVPLYEKYAAAIVNYCITAKKKTGKAPAIVGIQNEVTQPDEVWRKMTTHLREALDKNGFADVKIHMHNAVRLEGGSKALAAFSKEPAVWRSIDYTASNLYDYQNYFTNPDGFDKVVGRWTDSIKDKPVKPFLSVEMCVNDAKYQSGSYRIAFLMGELYHKNMVNLNAVSLMYCWLLINTVQPSFSASRSLFTIDEKNNNMPVASSYQLRVFGAFSRHLQKGFRRIEVTSSDAELLASAYSKGSKQILILLNRGTAAKKINLYDFKSQLSGMEIVSPYHNNEKYSIPLVKQIAIEPGSIVTLF